MPANLSIKICDCEDEENGKGGCYFADFLLAWPQL